MSHSKRLQVLPLASLGSSGRGAGSSLASEAWAGEGQVQAPNPSVGGLGKGQEQNRGMEYGG